MLNFNRFFDGWAVFLRIYLAGDGSRRKGKPLPGGRSDGRGFMEEGESDLDIAA